MPYVDLKQTSCFYCCKRAVVKVVFTRTGLYLELCAEHLKIIVNNLED